MFVEVAKRPSHTMTLITVLVLLEVCGRSGVGNRIGKHRAFNKEEPSGGPQEHVLSYFIED